MKLKILRNTLMADKIVSKEHHKFLAGSVIELDDKYLVTRLLAGNYAEEVTKEAKVEKAEKVEEAADKKEKKKSGKKMLVDTIKNKMMKDHLNK